MIAVYGSDCGPNCHLCMGSTVYSFLVETIRDDWRQNPIYVVNVVCAGCKETCALFEHNMEPTAASLRKAFAAKVAS
jgi:hypothetical protein